MKRFQLEITLHEELILSARSSTVGGNHSLDYLPGAALLGAAAARLYGQLQKDDPKAAFHLFHSGKVRFGNALPLSPVGGRGIPIPLAWHTGKGETIYQAGHENWLDGEKIKNLCLPAAAAETGKKIVQIRGGYVTADGYLLHPASNFRMKTAIDPDKASAATAQLFGYQSLQAGQAFRAYLDVDDDVLPDSVVEALTSCLHGRLQIGRSRSAQYGEIECVVSAAPVTLPSPTGGNSLAILLESDMALSDGYGMPTLTPTPAHFGIQGKLETTATFLRSRTYSPYNSKRRSYDPVRQVLEKGSVITFTLEQPLTADTVVRLQQGVGSYREHGLGQVILNHSLLIAEPPRNLEPTAPLAPSAPGETPDHPLARWLKRSSQSGTINREVRRQAEQYAEQLGKLYDAARRYSGQPEKVLVGPGATQWGRVYDKAKTLMNANQADELLDALFGDEQQAICKPSDQDWYAATGLAGEKATFACWLGNVLMQQQGQHASLLAANLAQIARTITREKEGRK